MADDCFLRGFFRPCRHDPAGRDRIDADVGRERMREGPRERGDRAFARGIDLRGIPFHPARDPVPAKENDARIAVLRRVFFAAVGAHRGAEGSGKRRRRGDVDPPCAFESGVEVERLAFGHHEVDPSGADERVDSRRLATLIAAQRFVDFFEKRGGRVRLREVRLEDARGGERRRVLASGKVATQRGGAGVRRKIERDVFLRRI